MNLRGMAVASDTILSSTDGGSTKTMGNMGKIYEIAPDHNVLILHSGSAELNGVPASLYVSEWSRTLAAPLPTLRDYVDSFIKWAGRDGSIHNESSEMTIMSSALNEHFGWASDRIRNALVHVEPKMENERAATFKKRQSQTMAAQIDDCHDYLVRLPSFEGMTEAVGRKALEAANYELEKWIESFFGEHELNEESRELLKRSASLAVAKSQPLSGDLLLAFVGYGAEEPFGGTIRLTCRGIYGGRLQATSEARFGVAPSESASGISHFAQGEAIGAFLRGADWRVMDYFRDLIAQRLAKISMDYSIELASYEIANEIYSEVEDYEHDNFIGPLLSTVEGMSQRVLAEFAESLVGLQATATYSQKGPATVGGTIEVATIDRKNGVIWKSKLN